MVAFPAPFKTQIMVVMYDGLGGNCCYVNPVILFGVVSQINMSYRPSSAACDKSMWVVLFSKQDFYLKCSKYCQHLA